MTKLFFPIKEDSATAETLDQLTLERKFGKSTHYVVVDVTTNEFQILKNTNHHMGGTGCTSDIVSETQATAVVAAHMGAGAYQKLKAKDLPIFQGSLGLNGKDIVEKYHSNSFTELKEPKGHGNHHNH